MSELLYITEDGLRNLQEELERLRTVERPMIAKMLSEATDKGDLSENTEYSAAKEAQGMLEMKIAKLENLIATSRVIDESMIDSSTVRILHKVKIRNVKNNITMEYQIVPESEADLKKRKIAVNSPIARGLIGKKVGDTVEIKVPLGLMHFEIMAVSL
ncbi:MAG: transcription elongation factor GreA [Bacteroidetes bacterium]|nr:transcription elongation factor GreA [Bacteroidota bacterium]